MYLVSDSFSIRDDKPSLFDKNDSLAARAKKLKESIQERPKRIHVKEIKPISEDTSENDVQFLIQVIMCIVSLQIITYPYTIPLKIKLFFFINKIILFWVW